MPLNSLIHCNVLKFCPTTNTLLRLSSGFLLRPSSSSHFYSSGFYSPSPVSSFSNFFSFSSSSISFPFFLLLPLFLPPASSFFSSSSFFTSFLFLLIFLFSFRFSSFLLPLVTAS
eukprot:GHVT01031575.1.p3 GENE.GHVT01031575.1~~GHVT01031575.1.p3  ORF type:complete len:115 (-),score=32.06 GHVT01031575.1:1603-1947(-)